MALLNGHSFDTLTGTNVRLGDDACRQKRNARWRQGSYTATSFGWYVYAFCITDQSGTYRLLLQVTVYGGGFLSAP